MKDERLEDIYDKDGVAKIRPNSSINREISVSYILDSSKVSPKDYEVCEKCQNLKLRVAKCKICEEVLEDEIVKFQKSKTSGKLVKIVEERTIQEKKFPSRLRYNTISMLDNIRGETIKISIPEDDVNRLVVLNRGGVHNSSYGVDPYWFLEVFESWKREYIKTTGKRPYKRTKRGRPRSRYRKKFEGI